MINSISVSNFQSHQATYLEFSKGVNIIIGNSDSGKSAIIRALKWLVWNRPGGGAYRSWWDGDTNVTIGIKKNTISRIKDGSNKYELNGTKFEAFGTGIPKEVSDVLNLTETNIQQQLDSPFLLASNYSAGDVAAHFNKVARLDKIDIATANVNSWIRSLESDIKKGKADEVKFTEQLEGFKYLTKMEIEVEVLESMEKQSLSLFKKQGSLLALLDDITDNGAEITQASEVLKLKPLLDKVLADYKAQHLLESDESKVQYLVDSIKVNLDSQKRQNKIVKLKNPVETVLALIKDKEPQLLAFSTLNKLLSNVSSNNTLLEKEKADLALALATFKKEMGSTCLLCGSEEKHWHLK